MKAVVRKKYGGPEMIEIRDVEIPTLKPEDALVKVHFTTVNRTDQGVITGLPYVFRFFTGIRKPIYEVLGTDFAGEVVAIGKEHKTYKVGDLVWGFNDQSWPTQAEYTIINKNICTSLVPPNVALSQVVASAEGFHYAINFLKKVELHPDKTAFVYGATGAIGSAMIQILKNKSMYVVTCCKKAHFEKVKYLNADKVLDYETDDIIKLEEKFDYFFDAVGKQSFGYSKAILKPKGVYISSELGPGAENLYLPLLTMWRDQKVIFPFPANIANSLEVASQMIHEKTFTPLIDRVFDINDAAVAYKYMMSQQKLGNVILKIIKD